jgi:hypothetical protein
MGLDSYGPLFRAFKKLTEQWDASRLGKTSPLPSSLRAAISMTPLSPHNLNILWRNSFVNAVRQEWIHEYITDTTEQMITL